MKKLFGAAAFLTLSLFPISSAFAHDWSHHYATEIPYRVVNVAGWDALNMRNGPSSRHRVVGALGPRATGIYIRNCAQHARWCLVEGNGKSGWVNMRFLAGYAN